MEHDQTPHHHHHKNFGRMMGGDCDLDGTRAPENCLCIEDDDDNRLMDSQVERLILSRSVGELPSNCMECGRTEQVDHMEGRSRNSNRSGPYYCSRMEDRRSQNSENKMTEQVKFNSIHSYPPPFSITPDDKDKQIYHSNPVTYQFSELSSTNSPCPRISPPSHEKTKRRRHQAWSSCPMCVGIILFLLISSSVSSIEALGNAVGLTGASQKCDNEGEVFPLPGSIDIPCFTCMCKGGRVECEKQQCPSLQGCYLILQGQKEGCCEVCKGCKVGNETYSSGTERIQNCTKTTCVAGTLTRSQIECYTPCTHPVPPRHNQCCPTCDSCSLNGREYHHGEEAILPEDPCVRCKCQRGSLTCTKNACPVLSCPASATYLEKGECCPKCNGSRTRYVPKKVCLLGDKAYVTGTTFRLDTCTNCTCTGNTAVCDRLSCPPLDCEPVNQIIEQGSCCPKCAEQELASTNQCTWKDSIYNNGEKWDVTSCSSCICDWGKVRCTEQMCPKSPSCGWGYKLKYLPGKCCPECVGEDGVCTVFGDPHYKSFDGRVFNFQGACKYMLTADCIGKTFAVRVRNDARESQAFSWTRTVTLKVTEGRITLGQRMRIKVNGKRVALPYNHGTLNIYMHGYSAVVETGVGVKLLWDGDSFLEVTVPHALQGRLCGLCGNFNGNKSDDFTTRREGMVTNPQEFGQSWRVGGRKSCSRPEEVKGPEPTCRRNWKARSKAQKMCEPLRTREKEHGVFAACHKAVSMDRFLKSCTFDMCECPVGRKCHCEVFTAYARACERSGIELGDWRERTGCSHKKRRRNSNGH